MVGDQELGFQAGQFTVNTENNYAMATLKNHWMLVVAIVVVAFVGMKYLKR